MNKMNGGYVMVKYDATQTELKNAYETKRPVIMYDKDNFGQYAVITLENDTYSVSALKTSGGSTLYEYKVQLSVTRDLGSDTSTECLVYASIISGSNFDFDEETDYAEILMSLITEQSTEDSGRFVLASGVTTDSGYNIVGLQYVNISDEEYIYPIYETDGEQDASISDIVIYKREL